MHHVNRKVKLESSLIDKLSSKRIQKSLELFSFDFNSRITEMKLVHRFLATKNFLKQQAP